MKILVIEDKQENQNAAKSYFEQREDVRHHTIFYAASLVEALEILKKSATRPEGWAVISDLNIPYSSEENALGDYSTQIHGQLVVVEAALAGVKYITISEHGSLLIYESAIKKDSALLIKSKEGLEEVINGNKEDGFENIETSCYWQNPLIFGSSLLKTMPESWDIAYTLLMKL